MNVVLMILSLAFGTSAFAEDGCYGSLNIQDDASVTIVFSNVPAKGSSSPSFGDCLEAFKGTGPKYATEVLGTTVPVKLEMVVAKGKLAQLLASIAELPAIESLETKIVFSAGGLASVSVATPRKP